MPEFDLLVARDQWQVLDLLAKNPDARMVAGATDFIPLVGSGKWKPRVAIDISRVAELRGCCVDSTDGGWFLLGALTTHAEAAASSFIQEHAAALAEACASVADPQIRGRATLGGNLCTASPAADSVPALLALGARLLLLSREGPAQLAVRRVDLQDFLRGPGRTDLHRGEVLAQIGLPLSPAGSASAFVKLGRRRAMAISVANAAAYVEVQDGKFAEVRVALGSVAPTVVRSRTTESALRGQPVTALAGLSDETLQAAVNADISPIDDVRASAAYRRQVAGALVRRALEQALERAGQPR
jgi:CO/xanthine dehydrogenase FAD-binding subunit